jgi:hypothetical protein
LPIWSQTVAQLSGACLLSSGVTGTYDSTNGTASIIGGPTKEWGYGLFSSGNQWNNMNIVIDGISVAQGLNPTLAGFDFRGQAQATIGTAGAFVNAATGTVGGTLPSHNWTFGLAMPNQGNNDRCDVYRFACEGYFTGLVAQEHLVWSSGVVGYCQTGIAFAQGSAAHSNWIGRVSTQTCQNDLDIQGTAQVNLIVENLDSEQDQTGVFAGGYHIRDINNLGFGYVGWTGSGPYEGSGIGPLGFPKVNSAQNLRIINQARVSNIFLASDAPGLNVPASGVLYRNPFFRDCMVNITGGTVTAIQLSFGYTAQNIPLTGGWIPFPSGAYIKLTYTGTPTWIFQCL